MGYVRYNWSMNTKKYKSIVVDVETYEYIKGQALEDDRAMTKTLKKYFFKGIEAECDECNLDSLLKVGGTPRMYRLLQDLRWYQLNSDNTGDKQFIKNDDERKAVAVVIAALADTLE